MQFYYSYRSPGAEAAGREADLRALSFSHAIQSNVHFVNS
jgi:hypothetical protein